MSENLPLGCGRLTTAIGHEWFRAESIEFSEPVGDVREYWLDENTAARSTDPNPVTFKPELARQSHRLTPTIPEKPGSCGHQVLPCHGIYR